MQTITRSVFMKAAAAALVAKFVPGASATTTPALEKPTFLKMAELLATKGVSKEGAMWAEVSLRVALHSIYQKQPFPVPDWLANDRVWASHIEDDKRKAEGTYCMDGEAHSLWTKCAGCGDYIEQGKPLHHYKATEADEMKVFHPECCPACIKAGKTPVGAARERKRQAHTRKGHYCASHESGPHGRCHECGRFMSKTEPRHVDARGNIYHPKCCRPCECRPAGEPNELPA